MRRGTARVSLRWRARRRRSSRAKDSELLGGTCFRTTHYLGVIFSGRSQTLFGNDIVSEAPFPILSAKQSFAEQVRSQTEFGNEERLIVGQAHRLPGFAVGNRSGCPTNNSLRYIVTLVT